MTTNLNAIAGPSKLPSPKAEVESPTPTEIHELSTGPPAAGGGKVNKQGLSVTEDGEMLKVPAFLNKLFSMVSTPDTDNLIYWSGSGDSFFIPNSERFGKELLPRFFKHNNFSSFVRQLNMYGFHKVPHLQTGALRNDNLDAAELWEFGNPFFKRGQSHLLSRVSRKNNRPGQPPAISTPTTPAHPNNARVHLITDGTTQGEATSNPGTLVGPTGQQVLDLSAITSGIAAIQRTQASIGADLKALQSSNEHLWREALEQRERHKTHQETIDLIVQFLERLFGTEGEGLKGLKEALRRGGLGRNGSANVGGGGGAGGDAGGDGDDGNGVPGSARKKRRLGLDKMISNGRDFIDESENGILELGSDSHRFSDNLAVTRRTRSRTDNPIPSSATTSSSDPWTSASQRFTALDDSTSGTATPLNPTSTPSHTQPNEHTLPAAHVSPMSDTDGFDPNTLALAPYSYSNYQQQPQLPPAFATETPSVQINGANPPPLSPNSTAAAAAAFNLDPSLLQTTIGSLLQSPAAAQMFLNSLNSSTQAHSLTNNAPNPTNPSPFPQFTNNNLNQQYPFPTPNSDSQSYPNSNNIDPTLALFSPIPNQEILQGNNEALLKSYQDAMSVGGDMDRLQEGIDSLVRSMGLDLPGQGQGAGNGNTYQQGGMNGNVNGMEGLGKGVGEGGLDMGDTEFDVDQFLESLGRDDEHVDMARLSGNGNGTGGI